MKKLLLSATFLFLFLLPTLVYSQQGLVIIRDPDVSARRLVVNADGSINVSIGGGSVAADVKLVDGMGNETGVIANPLYVTSVPSGSQPSADSVGVTGPTDDSFGISPSFTYRVPFMTLAVPTTLTNSAGAVATASTVLTTGVFCHNITATARTLDITNTAGTVLATGFNLPGNSFVYLPIPTGVLMVGVKWWASANSAINCALTGYTQ